MEDDAAPLAYLQAEMGGLAADARLRTFLRYGPEMVDFFRQNTAVQFLSGSKMPDFHNSTGFAAGGRSVTAQPYDARGLGDWLHRLRPPLETISLAGMGIAGGADMALVAWRVTAGNVCATDAAVIWSTATRWSRVFYAQRSTLTSAFNSTPRSLVY